MRLSGGYGGGCLEGLVRVTGGCGEAVWRAWGGCLEGLERVSEGCEEAVWRVLGGCLEGVVMLSGR